MKLRIYLLFVYCFVFQVFLSAQQNRFIYIQTENRQPFYINFNNNILSSSVSGYLIIPRLQEGTYQFTIGFPKNEWPRQLISYNIGKKDQGVLLKNYGEKGWGFIDLQNSEATMAAGNSLKAEVAGAEDDDNFTQVLSEVVNTPDLKIKEKEAEPVPVFVPDVKPTVQPIAEAIILIKRLSENNNDQGRELVYADGNDTISIFIPASITIMQPPVDSKIDSVIVTQSAVEQMPVVTEPRAVAENNIVAETNRERDSAAALPINEVKEVVKPASISMVNSDCKGNANDDDFMKLRKKMAAEENEVKMVVVAKKAFKSKCYSASQIKNLGVLFLNDSGRFQFFESAYPFVSDSNNFNGLQAQLTDPYYITRFETLIRR